MSIERLKHKLRLMRIPRLDFPQELTVESLAKALSAMQEQVGYMMEDFSEWAADAVDHMAQLESDSGGDNDYAEASELREQERRIDEATERIDEFIEEYEEKITTLEEDLDSLTNKEEEGETTPQDLQEVSELKKTLGKLQRRLTTIENRVSAIPDEMFEETPLEAVEARFDELEMSVQEYIGEALERLDQWEEDYSTDINTIVQAIQALKIKLKTIKGKNE